MIVNTSLRRLLPTPDAQNTISPILNLWPLVHLATIHEDIRPAYMTIVLLFRPAATLMYNAM
jgi:hypothetical protein